MRRLILIALLGFPLGNGAAEPAPPDFALYSQGRYVYERNCMICHGERGDGNGEMSKEMVPKPRSFREGQFKFRSTPFGSLPTEQDLTHTIRGGLSGTAMGMFTQLQDSDVRSVIEYIKSFSRRWRKPENYAPPMPLPQPPDWLTIRKPAPEHTTRGKTLFLTHCATCHGPEADGKGSVAAALKDAFGQPSHPSDLRQPHLRCGDNAIDIYRTLTTGLNGTAMISFDALLTPEKRWDICAYLLTIKRADIPTPTPSPAR